MICVAQIERHRIDLAGIPVGHRQGDKHRACPDKLFDDWVAVTTQGAMLVSAVWVWFDGAIKPTGVRTTKSIQLYCSPAAATSQPAQDWF